MPPTARRRTEWVRQNFLSNRVYDNYYEAIVDACCATWNALIALLERIRSIRLPTGVHSNKGSLLRAD